MRDLLVMGLLGGATMFGFYMGQAAPNKEKYIERAEAVKMIEAAYELGRESIILEAL